MNETATANGVRGYAAPPRGPVDAVVTCLRKSFDFRGRASRSEFWWFFLFQYLAGAVLWMIAEAIWNDPTISRYFNDAAFWILYVPELAAGARRLHDVKFSAWLLLLQVPPVGLSIVDYGWMGPAVRAYFEGVSLWWSFLPLALLVYLWLLKGIPGMNRYDSTR